MAGGAPGGAADEAEPAAPARIGWKAALVLLVLTVLYNDFWLWDDPRIVAGLPAGLTWHLAFCGFASLAFAWLVRGRE